mmetsp:Transcript_3845/g.5286  ORF Transcript_3845/g.5286 Transcript_3845/m.5286 type:complete len:240 (-) Transcript_3845:11-730(-)
MSSMGPTPRPAARATAAVSAAAAARRGATVPSRMAPRKAHTDKASVEWIAEFRVVKLPQCVIHITSVCIVDDAPSTMIYIGIHNISGLSHMIFEILPAGTIWQPGHNYLKVRLLGGEGRSSSIGAPVAETSWRGRTSAIAIAIPQATRDFYSYPISFEIILVPPANSIFRLAKVLEGDECIGGWSEGRFQIDFLNTAIFVKNIFEIRFSHVHGKIPNVYSRHGSVDRDCLGRDSFVVIE